MSIEQLVITIIVLLVIAYLSVPITRLTQLPYASILIIAGFVVSELVVMAGLDTGLRAENMQSLVFHVFIPLLVFTSALKIDKQGLRDQLSTVLFLAVIGMMFACAVSAVLLYFGIGHPSGFPLIAALLTGAILAATDPAAVVAGLKGANAPSRLEVLLEGESLFNDAVAILLFTVFLSMATSMAASEGDAGDVSIWVVEFITISLGGCLLGAFIGYSGAWVDGLIEDEYASTVLSLITAYGSFMLAEHLGVSGVMSTLMAGLSMSVVCRERASGVTSETNHTVLDSLSSIASAMLFIIVGAVITLAMFEERWLAMLIAIISVTIARAVAVYGGLTMLGALCSERMSVLEQTIVLWGGLRGAVAIALALSLPVTLDYWWTIQSIVFGVVVFTLFVQAPTMRVLLKRLD